MESDSEAKSTIEDERHRGAQETRNEVTMPKTISRDELKQKIDRKDAFRLVETLPATAYHHNHLPGAINLPPESVTALASQVLPDKGAEIVVYCAKST
jgi:rhodanese-related sulfurtransferase